MAKLKVFFKDNPKDLPAYEYLGAQKPWQRLQLEKFVSELELTSKIIHSDARLLVDGKWSLWVRLEGSDAVNHICYLDTHAEDELSPIANLILNPSNPPTGSFPSSAQRHLVIVGESVRPGEDPGSSDRAPESYCLQMDEVKAKFFLEVIAAIRIGAPSPYYSDLGNGTYRIHIDRSDLAYGVQIHCTACWREKI